MMGIRTTAIWVALAGVLSLPATGATAQTAPAGPRMAQAAQPVSAEVSAQRRVRSTARLRVYPYDYPNDKSGPEGVYPRYFPGRNAVRECNAIYVQEYRPSGAVIVPRVSCFWRPSRLAQELGH
jgi:hypothetical protein